MARGDLYVTNIPYPQGEPGREQAGRRPAIVIQIDDPSRPTSTVVVVPLTTNLKRAQFPYTVLVQPSRTNGLSEVSVLLVSQVRALDNARLGRKLGQLEPNFLADVESELRTLLGL